MLQKLPEARPGTLDNMLDAAVLLRYMVPVGHTLEDCLRPDYWKNNVREADQQRIKGRHAWNTIRCLAEDATWMADLLVLSTEGAPVNRVHTRLLQQWDWRQTNDVKAPDGYVIEHITGNGWRALEPGGVALTEKRNTRDDALLVALAHAARAAPAKPSPAPAPKSEAKYESQPSRRT